MRGTLSENSISTLTNWRVPPGHLAHKSIPPTTIDQTKPSAHPHHQADLQRPAPYQNHAPIPTPDCSGGPIKMIRHHSPNAPALGSKLPTTAKMRKGPKSVSRGRHRSEAPNPGGQAELGQSPTPILHTTSGVPPAGKSRLSSLRNLARHLHRCAARSIPLSHR